MDRTFRQRQDWFQVGVVPAIRRRTIIGFVIFVLCVAAWGYLGSWVPLLVGAVVVVERAFEITHIPKTKRVINSLSVSVNENGLAMRVEGVTAPVIYPWSSLSYNIASQEGASEAIWVEDRAQRRSKLKLVGYEGMGELIALIKEHAKRP